MTRIWQWILNEVSKIRQVRYSEIDCSLQNKTATSRATEYRKVMYCIVLPSTQLLCIMVIHNTLHVSTGIGHPQVSAHIHIYQTVTQHLLSSLISLEQVHS
jgi:hypothetical protein